jgi:hypothetical protein
MGTYPTIVSPLPRRKAPCGSTGMMNLEFFPFFARGLMPRAKFQRRLLKSNPAVHPDNSEDDDTV